jgi:hypothetical protein
MTEIDERNQTASIAANDVCSNETGDKWAKAKI